MKTYFNRNSFCAPLYTLTNILHHLMHQLSSCKRGLWHTLHLPSPSRHISPWRLLRPVRKLMGNAMHVNPSVEVAFASSQLFVIVNYCRNLGHSLILQYQLWLCPVFEQMLLPLHYVTCKFYMLYTDYWNQLYCNPSVLPNFKFSFQTQQWVTVKSTCSLLAK